jgi:hypothetical protein
LSWILTHLYDATKDPEHLRGAIEIWRKSIDSATEKEMFSRMAELHWNIANALGLLEEHLGAAENFDLASESYLRAAEKIPQLKDFYREYASYMRAWGEFERAKQLHAEKKYLQAKVHYENIAGIHRSTSRWSYLAPNYLAWARLEEAEDFSRKEDSVKAVELFREALNLFEEAKGAMESRLEAIRARERESVDLLQRMTELLEEDEGPAEAKQGRTQDEEEKELLIRLIQASELRRDYCLGRIALEEAITLDQRGDKPASSRRYGAAAEIFERIAGASEEARKEFQPLVCLCRAWQNMTQAEAEASPEKYLEASQLFEKGKDQCTDEKSRRLIQGHSHFCKALEAGTRFEEARDPELYSEAIRHLESAASLYVRAGFTNASEYAKATQRLFDAYLYMDKAGKETDPQEKARFYLMAERLLESSAESYTAANYPEKGREVERLLGRVRGEREMAASLIEVLQTTTIVPSTEAFQAPAPSNDKPVGLQRFEDADVQASLVLGGSEFKVNEDVVLEIELTNAGNGLAQLLKVEELVPEGFNVIRAPTNCRIEDGHLNMKRMPISPLMTEEVRLVLKPLEKGVFQLKPRVLYLDEAGRPRFYEPEPATITVKELGISGWLRGPRKKG